MVKTSQTTKRVNKHLLKRIIIFEDTTRSERWEVWEERSSQRSLKKVSKTWFELLHD
jgi:hypothetical protein